MTVLIVVFLLGCLSGAVLVAILACCMLEDSTEYPKQDTALNAFEEREKRHKDSFYNDWRY